MHRAHKKLDVWQESVALTTQIYRITGSFPQSERFGLCSQMQRAAVSVASNIAEGAARNSSKEFLQFLYIAGGSLSELDTQLVIAANLGYLSADQKDVLDKNMDSIGQKLAGLIRYQKSKNK